MWRYPRGHQQDKIWVFKISRSLDHLWGEMADRSFQMLSSAQWQVWWLCECSVSANAIKFSQSKAWRPKGASFLIRNRGLDYVLWTAHLIIYDKLLNWPDIVHLLFPEFQWAPLKRFQSRSKNTVLNNLGCGRIPQFNPPVVHSRSHNFHRSTSKHQNYSSINAHS